LILSISEIKYDISKMIIYNLCSYYYEIIFYSFLGLWTRYGETIVFSVLGLAILGLIIIVIHRFKNQEAYLEQDTPEKHIQGTRKHQKVTLI